MIKRNKHNWSDWLLTILLFVVGYVGTYFALSYAVPGLRLSMDPPVENYFAENLQYMMVPKGTASIVVGIILAMLPRTLGKK